MKTEETRPVERERAEGPKTGGKGSWTLLVGLCLAAVLAGGVAYAIGTGAAGSGSSAGEASEQAAGDAKSAVTAPAGSAPEHPALGSPDAPVTMIEYSDFQCPFCGKFARETEPELIEKYVEDGTLRIEWRDFPYLGQESANAALAARAAHAQGEFWRYHDLLFENQGSTNSGAFSEDKLLDLARGAGLDVGRFERDMKSGKYEAAVAADFEEGQSSGVTGTPTFLINGEALVGAQPIEVFEEAIEKAAKEAKDG